MADVKYIKSLLGVYPDFPKKGITFLDIFPILQDVNGFKTLLTHLLDHFKTTTTIDVIVGLDARGFLIGPCIAQHLSASFVPVRKCGKLPGETVKAEYVKEYGTDVFEMQKSAIKKGQNVVIIDDLIATGGSARAAGDLVSQLGGNVLEYVFVIELECLKGKDLLQAPVYSVIKADD